MGTYAGQKGAIVNPDIWIKFYGDAFFTAIAPHPEYVGMGYIKAIWYYWSATHCQGLADNDESLRRICQLDREQWEVAQNIIFDNDKFFMLGPEGKWHQKRAQEEWNIAKKSYDARVKNGSKGGRAKARNKR